MIADRKGGMFTRVLDWYIARKVRAAFRGVWVRGSLPSSDQGLLVYLNHSSWWDGFIAHQLAQLAGWNGFALMQESTLAQYRFHTRIGAFSVSQSPGAALSSIRYAAKVLSRPKAALIIFPEGELRAGGGPLGPLKRGVELIARAANVPCVPIALRYAFLEDECPDVLVDVGASHAPATLQTFTDELGTLHTRLNEVRSTESFTRAIVGRRGVRSRWDTVRTLTRPEAPSPSSSS